MDAIPPYALFAGHYITRMEVFPITMSPAHAATVLVVEDERSLADLYAEWLSEEYEVLVAYDGEEALSIYHQDVDVVLLDRRMPGISGDEVLSAIRDRDPSCKVAMVTAVDPAVDIVDMPFDDYVTKPLTKEDLHEAVERMMARSSYDDQIQRYFALASKKATLDAELRPAEREASEEYDRLLQELADAKGQMETTMDDMDPEDFQSLMQDLT